jgi:hypothetical protein
LEALKSAKTAFYKTAEEEKKEALPIVIPLLIRELSLNHQL